eukprot:754528-Hanusia_phi.AAC.2
MSLQGKVIDCNLCARCHGTEQHRVNMYQRRCDDYNGRPLRFINMNNSEKLSPSLSRSGKSGDPSSEVNRYAPSKASARLI